MARAKSKTGESQKSFPSRMEEFEDWVRSPNRRCVHRWAKQLVALGISWETFRQRDRDELVADLVTDGIPSLAARDIVGECSEAIRRCHTPLAVFWDLENMAIPTDRSGGEVATNIKLSLAPYGCLTQFRVYADFVESGYPEKKMSELQLSGCDLIHAPHCKRKEVADKMIMVDAMWFAFQHPEGATLCFLSKDVDFAYLLAKLKERPQWRTIVISSDKVPPSMLLVNCNEALCWETNILKRAQQTTDLNIFAELPETVDEGRSSLIAPITHSDHGTKGEREHIPVLMTRSQTILENQKTAVDALAVDGAAESGNENNRIIGVTTAIDSPAGDDSEDELEQKLPMTSASSLPGRKSKKISNSIFCENDWDDKVGRLRSVIREKADENGYARKMIVGSLLRSNSQVFPNRKSWHAFLSLAIERGIVCEKGKVGKKRLSLPSNPRSVKMPKLPARIKSGAFKSQYFQSVPLGFVGSGSKNGLFSSYYPLHLLIKRFMILAV